MEKTKKIEEANTFEELLEILGSRKIVKGTKPGVEYDAKQQADLIRDFYNVFNRYTIPEQVHFFLTTITKGEELRPTVWKIINKCYKKWENEIVQKK